MSLQFGRHDSRSRFVGFQKDRKPTRPQTLERPACLFPHLTSGKPRHTKRAHCLPGSPTIVRTKQLARNRPRVIRGRLPHSSAHQRLTAFAFGSRGDRTHSIAREQGTRWFPNYSIELTELRFSSGDSHRRIRSHLRLNPELMRRPCEIKRQHNQQRMRRHAQGAR